MEINLDKHDLVSMCIGTDPYYSVFEHPLVKECGNYSGGFRDEWNWNKSKLYKLTEDQLFELYNVCKNSWGEETRNRYIQ